MNRIKLLFGAALTLICSGALAQQNLFPAQDIKSAIVNEDSSVTFNFLAPKAHRVQIVGDFMEGEKGTNAGMVASGFVDMVEGEDGLWTYTTKPLESELTAICSWSTASQPLTPTILMFSVTSPPSPTSS